jgi:asparagine synthase (glutamine-hydrolysing)
MFMCAIAGLIGLDYSDRILQSMLRTMVRRGPDASDHVLMEDCALLHARLAVVDPDGGKQPMTIPWGAEEYTIIYNGELYNSAELRKQLNKLGHSFATRSDTEVVLRAYISWGEDALQYFNGIYAFVSICGLKIGIN